MAVAINVVGARQTADGTHILILKEVGGQHRFGGIEMHRINVLAVYAARMRIPSPRPSAHIAWAETVATAGIRLERLIIHGVGGDDSVLCLLEFTQGDRHWTVDCRPSDGIALALRLTAPIVCEDPIFALMVRTEDARREYERQKDNRSWRSYFESLDEHITKQ